MRLPVKKAAINVRVTPDFKERFTQLCEDLQALPSDVLRVAIDDMITRHGKRKEKSQLLLEER
jgi:hypothetical protein